MLLPQIPHQAKQKIATEFRVDIKIFGVTRTNETTTEEDRIGRLQAIVKYITENEVIGTPDQPAEYFAGTMLMRWGPFDLQGYVDDRDEDSPIVYFAGSTEQTLVGLGGSAKHVIGNTGASNPREWGGSAGPVLLQLLMNDAEMQADDLRSHYLVPYERIDTDRLGSLHKLGRRMADTFKRMQGPEQRLEFLAKRIVAGERGWVRKEGKPFLTLGTPLYVAMSE